MAASRPSSLIQYLRGALLPRDGDTLTDGQLLIIRRWIDAGAPRN